MATYKAVMRPALEYASSIIWSPPASLTSINKLLVIQNAALKIAHTTHIYNICMTKHSHFLYTITYSLTPHNTNRKYNIHHIPYTNIQHTSTLQSSTTSAAQQTFSHIPTKSLQQT